MPMLLSCWSRKKSPGSEEGVGDAAGAIAAVLGGGGTGHGGDDHIQDSEAKITRA